MSEQRELRPSLAETLGVLWCRLRHDAAMWPIHESYRCRTCGRNYRVPWAGEHKVQAVRLSIRGEETLLKRAA